MKGGGDGDGDDEMGVKRLGIPINQNDKGVGREGRGEASPVGHRA